ncbi:Fic family protein [uncultured Roseibium sp.]|uniref:Fic family protein n=1 Tax=uncultured Roseibium sp. TaxID=1936171 RepID=UPI0032161F97
MNDPAEPLWLTLHDIEDLISVLKEKHLQQPVHFGLGGRDKMLSALDRPLNTWMHEGEMNLINLAALYIHAIGKTHALIDGNKRLAFLSASVFLNRNFVRLVEPRDGFLAELVIALMANGMSLQEFQVVLAQHADEI